MIELWSQQETQRQTVSTHTDSEKWVVFDVELHRRLHQLRLPACKQVLAASPAHCSTNTVLAISRYALYNNYYDGWPADSVAAPTSRQEIHGHHIISTSLCPLRSI